MARSRNLRAAIAALSILFSGGAAIALLVRGDGATPVLSDERPIVAIARITPRAHLFGDRVVASLVLILNRQLVDPERLTIEPDLREAFAPYEAVGDASRAHGGTVVSSREDIGTTTILRYEVTLECLTMACLPSDEPIMFRPLVIQLPLRDGGTATLTVRWPSLRVASRLTSADLASPSFRSGIEMPPKIRSRWPLGTIAWIAIALAFITGVIGIALIATALPRRAVVVVSENDTTSTPTPILRDLALLERAVRGEPIEEGEVRQAINELADYLAASSPDGRKVARKLLAWSKPFPDRSAMRALIDEVRALLESEAS